MSEGVRRLGAWGTRVHSSIRECLLSTQTSWPLYVACVVAVTSLLYWRRPDAFYNPQLWAEDGTRFFSGAFFGGVRSLIVPFAGYYHTLARLIALAGRLVPIRYVPHWYYLASWSVLVSIIAYIFSARLPFNNGLRFMVGLAIVATTADNEVFMNLANVSFLVGLLWLLLAISSDPRSGLQAAFDLALLVLVGLSSPFVVSLWPMFFLRWNVRRSRHSLRLAALSLIVAFVQGWNMVSRISAGGALLSISPLFIDVLFYRFGFMFLGEQIYQLTLTNALRVYGAVLVTSLGFCLARSAVKRRDWAQLTVLFGGGMAAALSLYVFRHEPVHLIHSAGRHYFIPAVTFVWALLLSKSRPPYWARLPLTSTLVAFLFLTPGSKGQVLPDLDWAGQVSRCTGTRRICKIPINPVWDPPAWFAGMDSHVFTVPTMQTVFYSRFGGRIELLGYDVVQSRSETSLSLVWRAASTMKDDLKFFVHLFRPDDPATILAQQDAMPLDWQYPTSVWVAREIIVDRVSLPSDVLGTGHYQIAVGWYDPGSPTLDRLPAYDSQGRIWEGSRVVLPAVVSVP